MNNKKIIYVLILFGFVMSGFLIHVYIKQNIDNTSKSVFNWYYSFGENKNDIIYSESFSTEEECYWNEIKEKISGKNIFKSCFFSKNKILNNSTEIIKTSLIETEKDIINVPIDTKIIQNNIKNIEDTTAPFVRVLGDNPITINVGGVYVDAGVQAVDNIDGDVTSKVVVSGLPVVTFIESYAKVEYSVTDSFGNRTVVERRVNIVDNVKKTNNIIADTEKQFVMKESAFKVNTKDDLSFLQSCYERKAIGLCEKADFNKDGVVNEIDKTFFENSAILYEVTSDVIVELNYKYNLNMSACFFKIDNKGILECAKNKYGSLAIPTSYIYGSFGEKLEKIIMSDDGFVLDLVMLKTIINDNVLDRILYSTLNQFDFNNDGIINLSVSIDESKKGADLKILNECLRQREINGDLCKLADTNNDDIVTNTDLYLMNIFYGKKLLDSNYSITEIENTFFEKQLYTDAEVVKYCAENNIDKWGCSTSDVNRDSKINVEDWNVFKEQTEILDLNEDGIIDSFIFLDLDFDF